MRAVPVLDDSGAVERWIGTTTDIDHVKTSKRLLEESERRWKFALEGSLEGVWDWNLVDHVVFHSAQYRKLLGYPAQDFRGPESAGFDEVHPDDLDSLVSAINAHARRDTPFYCVEVRLRRADGNYVWVESRAMFVERAVDGSPRRMIGTVADISSRHESQEQIRNLATKHREIAENLQLALEAAQMGVWHWYVAEGRLVWPTATLAMFGMPPDTTMTYGRFLMALHPADRQRVDQAVVRSLETHTDFEEEYRVVWSDGSEHWILSRGRPFYAANGTVGRMEGVVQDITSRKLTEQGQRESAENLQLAVDGAQLGVWHWLIEANRLEWSDRCKAYFGLPADEVMSYEKWVATLHPDDRDKTVALTTRALEEKRDYNVDYRVVWPDGTVRWINAVARPYYKADGTLDRMEGVVQDITDRKVKERELQLAVEQRTAALEDAQRADRAKSAFLATTSHELKTPLNSVIGFSTLLLNGNMGEIAPQQREALAVIRQSGEQLLHLVKDVLDMSLIEAGRLTLSKQAVDLGAVLREQVEGAQAAASARHIELQLEACEDVVVDADRDRLAQVVRHLVANAIRCTDQGHVHVRVAAADGVARIEVADTGIGIPADQQHKIFKMFEPITGQSGRREQTGLGLAICRSLVEAMAGEIGFESQPGRGSLFWFTLPLARLEKRLPA